MTPACHNYKCNFRKKTYLCDGANNSVNIHRQLAKNWCFDVSRLIKLLLQIMKAKDKIIAAATIVLLLTTFKRNRMVHRTCWTDEWLLKFGTESDGLWYEKVFDNWARTNPERFRRTLRLPPSVFKQLLELVEPMIRKQDTHLRRAIPAEKRLAITLKYLATGESFYSLSGQFCVGSTTVGGIVKETCNAIIYALRETMRVPTNTDDWKEIADDFYTRWDYPNCVGALDGKHVLIKPPANSGGDYFNYQKTFSTVLMALVDSHCRFTYVDVGSEGRVGDAGVWNRCDLKTEILSNKIRCLPETQANSKKVPFHIVGDSAFHIEKFLMKPYSQMAISNNTDKRIFNYRLSRARRCVENAFGILAHRFEVFRAPIRTSVETSDRIVLAAIALHNWLMTDRMRRENYCPRGLADHEDISTGVFTRGAFRDDAPSLGLINLMPQGSNRSGISARSMRDYLCEFFVSPMGQRTWQSKMI